MKKLLTTTAILCTLVVVNSSGAKADPTELFGDWCAVADGVLEKTGDLFQGTCTFSDRERLFQFHPNWVGGKDWECSIIRTDVTRRQNVARPVYTLYLQCRGNGEQWTETLNVFLGKNDNLVTEVVEQGQRSIPDLMLAEDMKLMYKLCKPPKQSDVGWCSETLTKVVKAYPGFCQQPNAPCPRL